MGPYDGAEVCELVGIFLLFQLSQHYKREDFGLNRDDGLAIFIKRKWPADEKNQKTFCKNI